MNAYLFKLLIMIGAVFILAIGNILAMTYYNVGEQEELFDKKRFLKGLLKAVLILLMIASLTTSWIAFLYIEMVPEGIIDPFIICYTAAGFYFIKLTLALAKILGILERLKAQVSEVQAQELTSVEEVGDADRV